MADWSHHSQNEWGEQFPLSINGKRQSPVDIREADCVKESLPPFKIELIEGDAKAPWTLTNNGHTFACAPPQGVKWQLSGSLLEGKYILDHFHSHWGNNKDHGCEHLNDGKKYSGETHFVFKWAPGQGKDCEDGAVAFGFWMQEGAQTCDEAKAIFDDILRSNLDKVQSVGSVQVPGVDLTTLANSRSGEEYFTYKGSLTTPPFAEIVIHVVFKNPLIISSAVFEQLRNLNDIKEGKTRNNYRAIQPLLGRKITISQS